MTAPRHLDYRRRCMSVQEAAGLLRTRLGSFGVGVLIYEDVLIRCRTVDGRHGVTRESVEAELAFRRSGRSHRIWVRFGRIVRTVLSELPAGL